MRKPWNFWASYCSDRPSSTKQQGYHPENNHSFARLRQFYACANNRTNRQRTKSFVQPSRRSLTPSLLSSSYLLRYVTSPRHLIHSACRRLACPYLTRNCLAHRHFTGCHITHRRLAVSCHARRPLALPNTMRIHYQLPLYHPSPLAPLQ